MTTSTAVYEQHAQSVGKDVSELTDAEKKDAFLDAVLDGQRIEPYATMQDDFDAFRAACRPIEQFFEGWILELERKRSSENQQ